MQSIIIVLLSFQNAMISMFYYVLNRLKIILKQYELLEHVKDNTLIIICHYSVSVIYDLWKADRAT